MGFRTADGGHVNKPTSIWASVYDLIMCGDSPGACDSNHTMLRGSDAWASQVWPRRLAERFAWGGRRLLHRRRWQRVLDVRKHYPLM
eukprot:9322335-Pyramimonas_sp.AAC.1